VVALEVATRESTRRKKKLVRAGKIKSSIGTRQRTRTTFEEIDNPTALSKRQCGETANRACTDDDSLLGRGYGGSHNNNGYYRYRGRRGTVSIMYGISVRSGTESLFF
jgi:hypothetical protein